MDRRWHQRSFTWPLGEKQCIAFREDGPRYVYFPAASKKMRLGNLQLPVRPDFGRMRWIW